MTNLPDTLYRAVSGNSVESHLNGNFWFRSHASFRIDGDKNEGVGSHLMKDGIESKDVSDDFPVQPAYFMCFSESPKGSQACGRSDHRILRLRNPDCFLKAIKSRLPESSFVVVKWIKIEYTKQDLLEDWNPSATFHRKFHCKFPEFASEREWRLQIQFMHSFHIMNDDLRFHWRSFGQTFFDIV